MAAADASAALHGPSSCPQLARKNHPWGAAEIRCTQCGKRVPSLSGHQHELQCGHTFCEQCLLITEGYSTTVSPNCEVATTISTRQEDNPIDECIKEDSLMEKLQPEMTKNCSQDFKKTVSQPTIGLENSASTHRTVLSSSSVMAESKTTEEIDDALTVAGYNFEQLSTAVKMLKHMHNQAKEETDSLIEILEKQFDQLFASLHSRKKSLCEEVVRNTDDYFSYVVMTKDYVEEKKNYLDAAMKIARELKSAPSLRTYCDLSQIIRTLKLSYESELSEVASLKLRRFPRLNINCSEITYMFNNIGKIEFEDSTKLYPQENAIGQTVQKKFNTKKKFSCHAAYQTNEAHPVTLLSETNEVHSEAKPFQSKKEVVTKTIAALPQMGSSPDVIIEEIIEENPESSPELVLVSHVIHPCHFYIRKYSQIKDATLLEKKVNQICNKSLHLSPSDILDLGTRIFVNSIENGMWCRGMITELIPIENKDMRKPGSPTKCSVCEVALLQIFMVDFGNSEVLIVPGIGETRVRPEHIAEQHIVLSDLCLVLRKPDSFIEEMLEDIQPFAQPCSLKDIVPPNSNKGWGKEAKMEFLKMVNNKAVLMKVFQEEDGMLIVDLQKPPTNKISSDMPVSLRDALVFMELARFRSQSPRSYAENTMTLHYNLPVLPNKMTNISVMVCHINSPSDFYLQLIESLDFLFLLKTMEEFYKSEDEENLEIFCPVQGQACVAKFEDGIWYRAKVIGLPGHREVEVKYVDFGNTAKVTLKDMRKIKDEFLSPPEKAMRCKLAYIEPCKKAMRWSKEAKEKFEEKTQDKFMTCSIIKILEDNVLSVELFDSFGASGMTSTSINDQLVKEGLASHEVGLEEKMVAAYENSKWEPIKWENDMHCAVLIPDKNQWRRGQIIRVVSDTVVEVLLYDVGVELTVNINHLRELEENLKTMGRLSLECSLVNIRPTGGSDKWTATACDCLSFYLTGAIATIIIQENNTMWPLPVKIFCKDEKGERVDVSKYLIKKGLALKEKRISKLENNDSLSEKPLEISLEHVGSVDTTSIKINCDPDKKAADNSEQKVSECKDKVREPKCHGCYKPPTIPNMEVFDAVVSCIGDDGTIFVVPKLSEFDLVKMMNEIQNNLKCLGLLEPYFWKKGEACAVRGSDTLWYRGRVMEVVSGTIRVQYLDHGFMEKIPQCHLYPILLYPDKPQFCIPCQLHNTIPIGNAWQPDAIGLLQELLSKREVEIHVMTPTDYDKKVEEESWEIRFEVYICLDPVENFNQCNDTDDSGVGWESESESLDEALQKFNKNVDTLLPLTDFRTEMPCLAKYDDGLWYRAKIVSIKEFNPLAVLVQFVDYGSTEKLTTNRLCQIPLHLMQYPTRAIKVLLAGFKPPVSDPGKTRIPYCPNWSMEALWAMIDCLQGKQLYASSMAQAPEQIVTLYEDEQYPVHMPLVEMGLAERDD
ncbi:RING finger protein 17 [Echinops telfairi]|uniref:RING finger protein 17 n=1 Tax=Echinops telfairi TaxID=9371 RepID=A0AC55DDX7_ECHTE|nr:RING finger protein 17 [Echinops telfairi]